MTTVTEITRRNHRRAVRFFWGLLIGATMVSLIGNIAHAALSYIPHVVIQIGAGAFAVSFLALRDLMLAIGYRSATAWVFPAIIDTAVAVSTLMLVALGDKPARRARAGSASTSTQAPRAQRLPRPAMQSTKGQVRASAPSGARVPASASLQRGPAQTAEALTQTEVTQVDAEIA